MTPPSGRPGDPRTRPLGRNGLRIGRLALVCAPIANLGRPYFVWYSDSLRKNFPEKIENLRKHVNASISSENIIHTFTSIGNVWYPKQDSSKNIASPYFKDNQQRILGANMKVYNCNSLK